MAMMIAYTSRLGMAATMLMGASGSTALGQMCSFQKLMPDQPSNSTSSISSDGRVIVGQLGGMACRWVDGGAAELLGQSKANPTDASANGSVIVGYQTPMPGTYEAFRWTSQTGMQSIDTGGKAISRAFGVSADGAVIVGTFGDNEDTIQAFRWTELEGMQSLGMLTGYPQSSALSTTSDGELIVGACVLPLSPGKFTSRAFAWTLETGMQPLSDLGGDYSAALDVSEDGIIVGGARPKNQFVTRAVRWVDGIIEVLETGPTSSFATGISSHGHSIVGYMVPPAAIGAFTWTANAGVRQLGTLEGAWLYPGNISDVGLVFPAHVVVQSSSRSLRWGSRADCDTTGSLTIEDFVCFQTLFALGDKRADCDSDGQLLIDDFVCFQTEFAVGC